jgi:CBS domain containing-hemolysin-like protein
LDKSNRFITSFIAKFVYDLFDWYVKSLSQFEHLFSFLLQRGKQRGFLSLEEAKVINRAFKFRETTAREIMVPSPEIVWVTVNTAFNEIIDLIIKRGHSRVPICKDNLDNILGIIHAKDLLRFLGNKNKYKIELTRIIFTPLFVPETQKIARLLKEMNLHHIHLAIVVDEHGSTVGLVTLEDIIEEIFGEIHDEYDKETIKIVPISKNTWQVLASVDLGELEEAIHIRFPQGKYETLAGFLTHLSGKVGRPGEKIEFGDLEFCVLSASPRRIHKVLVKKIA